MTSQNMTFHREVPIRHDVDVFVAGGGPAGVAAAVIAARQGLSIFLAEGQGCLGGMGTAGLVPAFMTFGDGENFLAGGFGQELLDRLEAAGGVWPMPIPPARRLAGSISIDAEVLKSVYDDVLIESGAAFAFQTQLIGVDTADHAVTGAICAGKSGLFAVRAKVYIDCTGDGDLAAWAGAPFEKGDEHGTLMPGTLCSLWAGIDHQAVQDSGIGHRERLDDAFRDKVFTTEDRHVSGMWRIGESLGGANIGHAFGVDSTDERSVTEAFIQGRKTVREFERYYKEYLKGYEKMQLAATGSLMGIRESRRIMGDYVLCVDDFTTRAVFEDEIGRYCYPVDIHPSEPGPDAYAKFKKQHLKEYRYGPGESYGIAYRCLLPRGLSNVLVAGRCISSDRYLQSSVRVMPGCYITGQAAALAAVVSVEHDTAPRAIDRTELRSRLRKIGAYLPY
ncbi:MAG: FAD-dependent oxidoreductase [Planctomycetes bacterium]|nr:FAD-dependent oxidoreductase [Planctomycetota bacterium]